MYHFPYLIGMNNSIFYLFYNLAHHFQWFDHLVWFFAVPFIYIVIVGAVVFFIIDYRILAASNARSEFWSKCKKIFFVLFSSGLAFAISKVLKIIIHTDRPFIKFTDVHALFYESGYAFPSGHSATIAALAFSVFYLNKRAGYVCMAAALLIGIARITSGVHFPIDILGGYLIGYLVAFFVKSL
jgi:undecaprenyl-diphosphatase